MNIKITRPFLYLMAIATFFTSCGGDDYVKPPLDVLIREMDTVQDFTIILYDMNVEDKGFSDEFFHKYKVVTEDAEGKPVANTTEWLKVDEKTFAQYETDMGMEIASKTDGKLEKSVAPPGYSNYVGNSQYGQWRTGSNGTSFWEFYGQYAFISSMMGLVAGPVYRTPYYNYRNNYRGSRPYYGRTSSGSPRYGTLSQAARTQNPTFFRRASTNSALKSRVNNSISRSSTGRTSRSGSRYGGSTRSRSSSRGGK